MNILSTALLESDELGFLLTTKKKQYSYLFDVGHSMSNQPEV